MLDRGLRGVAAPRDEERGVNDAVKGVIQEVSRGTLNAAEPSELAVEPVKQKGEAHESGDEDPTPRIITPSLSSEGGGREGDKEAAPGEVVRCDAPERLQERGGASLPAPAQALKPHSTLRGPGVAEGEGLLFQEEVVELPFNHGVTSERLCVISNAEIDVGAPGGADSTASVLV